MKRTWSRFLHPLTPGVRGLIFFLALFYLALLAGRFSRLFDLYDWFALSPPAFWRGRVWTGLTYAWLPFGPIDFLINGFMLAWLGVWLERSWTRQELWLYCALCATGAGLACAALLPAAPVRVVGSSGAVFGLLAAWARLFGHERVLLMAVWEMSVRWTALLLAGFTILISLPCAGPRFALAQLCGGLAGWTYLALRSKIIHAQRGRLIGNERMNRLEL